MDVRAGHNATPLQSYGSDDGIHCGVSRAVVPHPRVVLDHLDGHPRHAGLRRGVPGPELFRLVTVFDVAVIMLTMCAFLQITRGMIFILMVSLASSLVRVPFHLFRILFVDTHFEIRYDTRTATLTLMHTSLSLSFIQERGVNTRSVVLGANEDVLVFPPFWYSTAFRLSCAPQLGSALLLDM